MTSPDPHPRRRGRRLASDGGWAALEVLGQLVAPLIGLVVLLGAAVSLPLLFLGQLRSRGIAAVVLAVTVLALGLLALLLVAGLRRGA